MGDMGDKGDKGDKGQGGHGGQRYLVLSRLVRVHCHHQYVEEIYPLHSIVLLCCCSASFSEASKCICIGVAIRIGHHFKQYKLYPYSNYLYFRG